MAHEQKIGMGWRCTEYKAELDVSVQNLHMHIQIIAQEPNNSEHAGGVHEDIENTARTGQYPHCEFRLISDLVDSDKPIRVQALRDKKLVRKFI